MKYIEIFMIKDVTQKVRKQGKNEVYGGVDKTADLLIWAK